MTIVLLVFLLLLLTPFLILNLTCFEMVSFTYELSVCFFSLNMLFILSVFIISATVMKFSSTYMLNSLHVNYFNAIFIIFMLSMCSLLTMNSLLMLFFSWEMLGVSSWLLVLFYLSWSSIQGSFLTIFINRMGDVFLLVSFILMKSTLSAMLILIIFVLSATKSAQFPFSMWLPAAMAAPTPVSALVHSSTLVTAGLYLLFRFNFPVFNIFMMKTMFVMGILTMAMGSFMSLLVMDLKKIVAFSTLSQLGLMMMSFSSLWWGLLMFQLLTHAFVKSMLFIMVGFFMMSMSSQNLLKVPNLFNKTSHVSMVLLLIFNFISLFFTAMFVSKEWTVLYLLSGSMFLKMATYFFLVLTLLYTLRLIFIFFKGTNMFKLQFLESNKFWFQIFLYFLVLMFSGMVLNSSITSLNFVNINLKFFMIIYLLFSFTYFFIKNFLIKMMLSAGDMTNMLWLSALKLKKEEVMSLNWNYTLIVSYKSLFNSLHFSVLLLLFIF